MRIAALDLGSNSLHLVVVEAEPDGSRRVLAREKAFVRLARGEANSGEISPEAFEAGLAALEGMARTIEGHRCDTVLAYGTAALRDARNAGAFVEAARGLGIPVRIISGEEEAHLVFEAVSHVRPFPEEPLALMDVGGGSTELTWVAGGRVLASFSVPMGAQRLHDLAPCGDPPKAEALKALSRLVRKVLKRAWAELPPDLPKVRLVLATSGTLEALAQGASGRSSFSRAQLQRFHRRLWHTTLRERTDRMGIDPRRAEALPAGAAWALALVKKLGAQEVHHLPVGVRDGMVWEALRHGGAAIPPLAERRRASAEALAARLDPRPERRAELAAWADRLFLAAQPCFELGDWEREWLGLAALLQGVGRSVSDRDAHKHGAYLIRHADLTGFWPEEVEILAQVVRHHRGKEPDIKRHEAFGQLPPWHRGVVRKLSALLRAARWLAGEADPATVPLRLEEEALHLGILHPEPAAAKHLRPLERLLGRPLRFAEA